MKRTSFIFAIIAFAVSFFFQAMWESPLRPFVWTISTIGNWFAWHLVDRHKTWTFDTVAFTVNGGIYLLLFSLIRLIAQRVNVRGKANV